MMKNKLLYFPVILILTIVTNISLKTLGQSMLINDSVVMGPGYANEIYYSMSDGVVSSYLRNSWDIAVRSRIMSSSILTNDGTGVILYTYPKSDTSGWATVDTTGYKTWKALYNDPDDWENGAFSRNATGGLDFGWGIYNTTTHHIKGDSLYVIQLRDGSLRKLWIQLKKAGEDLVYFRFANIDGSDEHNIMLDCNYYTAKDFIGYSLINNEIVDYQPDIAAWDIVFTKYMSVQQGQSGVDTVYPVTGVLNNEEVYAEKFMHVAPDFTEYNPYGWDSTRASIGYDWKAFTGTGYTVSDSLAYFVKTRTGDVYKLVFTKFSGSSSGKIFFKKWKVAGVGFDDQSVIQGVRIYPNPAKDVFDIWFPEAFGTSGTMILYDITGKNIYQQQIPDTRTKQTVQVSDLPPGIYLLKVSSEKETFLKKVIISR